MLIYNITIQIVWTIQPEWVAWVKDVYAKEAIESGCFTSYQLVRLLDIDENEGPTYALQLYTDSRDKYVKYAGDFQLQQEAGASERWGSNMLAFGTLMEVIE